MCLQHSESLFKILYIVGAKFCFYVSKIASKEKCSAKLLACVGGGGGEQGHNWVE